MSSKWQQSYQVYRMYVRNLALLYQKRQDIRIYAEFLLSVSVITIFILFAIRPTLVTLTELNSEIKAKQEIVMQLDQKIDALDQAQVNFTQNREAISLLTYSVPSEPQPVEYARQMEGLAAKHGLFVLTIEVDRVTLKGFTEDVEVASPPQDGEAAVDTFPRAASSIEVRIDAVGSFIQVSSFLDDFERMLRPIHADTFEIRTSLGTFQGGVLVSINGRVPYLPPGFSFLSL